MWDAGDDYCPRVEVSFYRGDEPEAPYPDCVGVTDMDIRIGEGSGAIGDVDGWVSGTLSATQARRLAVWLLRLADEIDPAYLNGQPPRAVEELRVFADPPSHPG